MAQQRKETFYLLIAILLSINGVLSFAYASLYWDKTLLWAFLTVNFLFYTGATQGGIVFSALMRIAGAGWGRYFSRPGEVIAISSAPLVFFLFLFIVYGGGPEHLFYWISPGAAGEAASGTGEALWFHQDLFFWRNLITMALFYAASYAWFRTSQKGNRESPPVAAGLVLFLYILHNTVLAWDFGMTIIPHWESTIFPPYFFIGNLFSGVAFILLLSPLFKNQRDKTVPMGKFLLGFTLFWLYLHWAQYIVIWYGNIPRFTEPLFRQMTGNYRLPFALMILTAAVLPFAALIRRRVKSSEKALALISLSICAGIWINKYLMILPQFSDGTKPLILTWTGLSLIGGGFGMTLLSLILFLRLFPSDVTKFSHPSG